MTKKVIRNFGGKKHFSGKVWFLREKLDFFKKFLSIAQKFHLGFSWVFYWPVYFFYFFKVATLIRYSHKRVISCNKQNIFSLWIVLE